MPLPPINWGNGERKLGSSYQQPQKKFESKKINDHQITTAMANCTS